MVTILAVIMGGVISRAVFHLPIIVCAGVGGVWVGFLWAIFRFRAREREHATLVDEPRI